MACNPTGAASSQAVPSAAAPEAATPPASGIPVSATPIRLVIPDGLATSSTAETIDIVTDQTGAPWDVAPAHLQLTFQGYTLQSSYHVPQIFVYPGQQYAGLNPAAAESLKRLQTVLSNPSGSYGKDTLPRAPFLNAAQVFAAQQKLIHFNGGSGVRFITQYGQDVSPINNSGLFYHFEGLTDDGQYYIVAVLPVNLPFLPADNNPQSSIPSGGVPFPAPSNSPQSYEDYFKQVTQKIDASPGGKFSPSLDTLDALIQSIATGP
jgi:hypothetical protein